MSQRSGLDCFIRTDLFDVKCSVCQTEFTCTNTLVWHLRAVHGYLDGKALRLKCAHIGCGCVLGAFPGFRKPLNTKHTDSMDQQGNNNVNSSSADLSDEVEQETVTVEETSSSLSMKSDSSTLDMCAAAVSHLKAAGFSQSNVKRFISSMEEVVFEIHTQAKDAALQCFSPQRWDFMCCKIMTCKTTPCENLMPAT